VRFAYTSYMALAATFCYYIGPW